MAQWEFPESFLWGTATASYQVEGAVREGGRGKSIWDTFSHTHGTICDKSTGDVTCDQYHRYAEDVALMRELGVGAYRFSIAWPRVFPEGKGKRNPKGFDYYHRLIDHLLKAGVQPAVTLYHWDLPQALEDEGGWPARDTALRFADYARACYEALGDKVKFWMTLNEPPCTAFVGYEEGRHAPGVRDGAAAFRAAHHLNLAHGLAVQAYRATGQNGLIGIVMNPPGTRAATRREEDVLAADRARDKTGRIFLDPIFGRGYPQRLLDAYPERPIPLKDGDLATIAQRIDFLGINMYYENAVAHDESHPEKYRTVATDHPKTAMGWDITPRGMYRMLKWVNEEYGPIPIYVTENGCATPDKVSDDGRCHDPGRIDYLEKYLGSCAEAMRDGVDLRGYFLWTFIDNFEWAHGFTQRFGIVYCDYEASQKRIPKDSFYYYREVIAGNEGFGERKGAEVC